MKKNIKKIILLSLVAGVASVSHAATVLTPNLTPTGDGDSADVLNQGDSSSGSMGGSEMNTTYYGNAAPSSGSLDGGSLNSGSMNTSYTTTGALNQGASNSGSLNQAPTSNTSGFSNNSIVTPYSSGSNTAGVPKVSFAGLVAWIVSIIGQIVYVIVALALVAFLYGILKLSFVDGTKPEAREQARKFMVWGIVSLFVMISVWGLVSILKVTFFGTGSLIVPQLK